MTKVFPIAADCSSEIIDMVPGPQLIWMSLAGSEGSATRRILDLLSDWKPLIVNNRRPAVIGERYSERDLIVIDVPDWMDTDDAEVTAARTLAGDARILLRSKAPSPGVDGLDVNEGPELTRARILRVLREGKNDSPVRHEVPAWRKNLIGESRPMQKVAEIIRLVGPRRCTVLITGETGTGKEVVARALHQAGPRSSGPFVAVNCGAIPAALLEAELFGHTRGAFTGATQMRVGRFEQAHGGTLFLDEIGELPFELQAKLLRVLQEREFQRLGSSETVRVDARILAATNCDLRTNVREGSFREDLFYRLNVVPLELPPLRSRISDLRPLVEHFVARVCREEDMESRRLTPDAWIALESYNWPGNVRQLENAISSAVVLSENRTYLDADDFTLPYSEPRSSSMRDFPPFALPEHGLDFTETVNALERRLLSQALQKTKGNKKAAADMLRLKRTTLSAKVRVLDICEDAICEDAA